MMLSEEATTRKGRKIKTPDAPDQDSVTQVTMPDTQEPDSVLDPPIGVRRGAKNESHLFPQLGVGERIKLLRENRNMSQTDIGRMLALSRTAISQWEQGLTLPTLPKIAELAALLRTTPQYIAFGIADEAEGEEREETTISIPEVRFGDSMDATEEVEHWSLPVSYVRNDLRASNPDSLLIYEIESEAFAPRFAPGDRLIVDTSARKPHPEGAFLIWNGVSPVVAHIAPEPIDAAKVTVFLTQDRRMDEGHFVKCPASDVRIIGRIRGKLSKAVGA